MPAVPRTSTGLAITNPLVLYRALLATKRIDPDPAQHRLALHLQILYDRLKDYEPVVEYQHRLSQISRALSTNPEQQAAHARDVAAKCRAPQGVLASLFEQKEQRNSLALTRVLTSHEEIVQMESPRGLMLHGEVGTGKSMLVDLFADCLPNRKKKRWHFTTFMLEILSKLEYLRRSRQTIIPSSLGQQEDYSLLWLARDMISTSPILFLDEFQLPDRAASKIMTNLMTCFFQLGGVLICTSNRMPEELAKAAGMEFAAPAPRRSFDSLRQRLGLSGSESGPGRSEAMYSAGSDFGRFLDVLKARCEVWQMEGGKDYRRREAEQSGSESPVGEADRHLNTHGFEGLDDMSAGNIGLGYEQSRPNEATGDEAVLSPVTNILPKQYLVKPSIAGSDASILEGYNESLAAAESAAFPDEISTPIAWSPSTMRVYGRSVAIPRQLLGVTHFTFDELCGSALGPADYITLASTFHTLILTDVPVLSILQKNEARRFITLLDALYEARCKLLITAAAGPDSLFFPENTKSSSSSSGEETVAQDATLPETLSDIYQDATAPFRPNVSAYTEDPGLSTPAEPDFTHSRLAGVLSYDQLEDGPPNQPHPSQSSHDVDGRRGRSGGGMGRSDSIYGLDTGESSSLDDMRQALARQRAGPDFSKAGIFTGEDEKFAYKRARSRLWEMCGKRWWERTEEGWWNPLESSVRRWEGVGAVNPYATPFSTHGDGGVPEEPKVATAPYEEGALGTREIDDKQDEVLYKYGNNASPFRRMSEPPPKFSFVHIWGNMKWGKKAGAWGQGVEGLEERQKEREKMREGSGSDDRDGERSGKGGRGGEGG